MSRKKYGWLFKTTIKHHTKKQKNTWIEGVIEWRVKFIKGSHNMACAANPAVSMKVLFSFAVTTLKIPTEFHHVSVRLVVTSFTNFSRFRIYHPKASCWFQPTWKKHTKVKICQNVFHVFPNCWGGEIKNNLNIKGFTSIFVNMVACRLPGVSPFIGLVESHAPLRW